MDKHKAYPIYRKIADQLVEAIRAEVFPVGSRMPGELELRERFDVSRHTIREALRLLETQGLIRRSKGVGTVVISAEADHKFHQPAQPIERFLAYADNTLFRVLHRTEVVVNRTLSERLGVPGGSTWVELAGPREHRRTGQVVCWSDLYVTPRLQEAVEVLAPEATSTHDAIEKVTQDTISRVDIKLGCAGLTGEAAKTMGLNVGQAAPTVQRRYHGRRSGVCAISTCYYPPGEFAYDFFVERSGSDAA